jgi:plasmid stabilization system protein ParE
MKVSIHPEALTEFEEAAAHYEDRQPGLGEKLVAAVESAIQGIVAFPTRWPLLEKNVQRRLVKVFPYAVLYYFDGKSIVVLAIMHSHRRPAYWRSRSST